MAFGFFPKHQQEELIEGLSSGQLLALSLESLKALDWKVSYISPTGVIAWTSTSAFTTKQEITVKINENKIHFKSACVGSELFDLGRNKKNAGLFFNKLKDLREKTAVEQLNDLYAEIAAKIAPGEDDLLNKPPETSQEKFKGFFSIFIPREGFYITPLLIYLNIIVFILMLINGAGFIVPDNQVLVNWGGNFRPLTVDGGQWWRIFTSTFIHAGILHLLMNMYALLYIGLLLEPYLGKVRFATFYILTGLAASTTSLFWHDFTVCIGASGAIFGLYGIFLAMLTTNLIEKTARKAFLTSIIVFVAYNLMNGIKGNIDNAAHIGGLLSGIGLGYGAYFSLKTVDNLRVKIATVLISIATTVILISIVYQQFPRNYAIYDAKMQEFANLEAEALQFYSAPIYDSTATLNQVNAGLDKWEKCLVLFDSMYKLDLPVDLLVNVETLRKYVKLRIETFELIREGIEKDSVNEKLLSSKYNQIDSMITEIQN